MATLPRHCYRLPKNFTKYLLSAITIELFKYRNYHEYLNQHKMFVTEAFNINKDIKVLVTSYPMEKREDLYEVSAKLCLYGCQSYEFGGTLVIESTREDFGYWLHDSIEPIDKLDKISYYEVIQWINEKRGVKKYYNINMDYSSKNFKFW
jgi:hypothetical protein|nr:MAG TPA: hypothetical protein [Caudoviricetes sp.]